MSSVVSIIIPAYNAADYIGETLESIIKQSYANWECLVINDGSTDNTALIAESFASSDSRIQCFHKPNGGLCSARNYGLSQAKGDYIQYLDSDDVLFTDKIELMVEHYGNLDEDNVVLFCDFIYGMDTDPYKKSTKYFKLFRNFNSKKKIGFSQIYKGWDYNITIPIHCFLFPAGTIKNILFDEKLKSKEDWDYHLCVLDNNNYFLPCNYTGCSYRVTKNSMSKDYTSMIAASLIILHRWNKNQLTYFYRISFYVLQGFIYKVKGERISLIPVKDHFRNKHRYYFMAIFATGSLMPVVLLSKILNSLRIRIK